MFQGLQYHPLREAGTQNVTDRQTGGQTMKKGFLCLPVYAENIKKLVSPNWRRPTHINLKIYKCGFVKSYNFIGALQFPILSTLFKHMYKFSTQEITNIYCHQDIPSSKFILPLCYWDLLKFKSAKKSMVKVRTLGLKRTDLLYCLP